MSEVQQTELERQLQDSVDMYTKPKEVPQATTRAASGNGNGHKQTQSETIGKLVEALAKAQLEFTPIFKEAENQAFMRGGKASKYATLDAVINATRPAMAKYGLVLFQLPHLDYDGMRLSVRSKLSHTSGEWIEDELVLPAADTRTGFTAHTVAKAITYARRYSWQAMIGCTAEEDDDGNEAAGQGTKDAAQAVAKQKLDAAGVVESLFYVWHDESQTAEITGSESLKATHRNLLRPLWNAAAGAIVASADQLEGLKYEFEKLNVPFRPLKATEKRQKK